MNQIGGRVKRLRNQIGYSQETVARKADVSLATVQRLEANKGTPNLDTLARIADALDVTLVQLFEDGAVA